MKSTTHIRSLALLTCLSLALLCTPKSARAEGCEPCTVGLRFNAFGIASNEYWWFDYLPLTEAELGFNVKTSGGRFQVVLEGGIGYSGAVGLHLGHHWNLASTTYLGLSVGAQYVHFTKYPDTGRFNVRLPVVWGLGDKSEMGIWPYFTLIFKDTTSPSANGSLPGGGLEVTIHYR